MFNFIKKNDFVEYIEFDTPFKVKEVTGEEHEGITWRRISKPSENTSDYTFRNQGYLFISANLTGINGRVIDLCIDEEEYNKLKKISKRNKKITFNNPLVINIAIATVVILFSTLIVDILTNLDKIITNLKLIF